MEETSLIVYEEVDLDLAFSSKDNLEQVLGKLKKAAEAHVPDLETEAGRKAVASNSYKVSRCKTWMVDHAKGMTEDWRKKTKTVNELKKYVETFCDDLRDSTRKPLTDLEETEKAERERKRKEMEMLQDWDEAITENERIDNEREMARKIAEFERKEAEQKAKEQAEQAEKDRKERESRIAAEAAEAAKKEAKAAIEKAERDRLQAIEDAKREKERAEKARIKAIEDAKEEKRLAVLEAEQKARQEAERKENERMVAVAEQERIVAEEKRNAERLAQHKAHRRAVRNTAINAIITVGNFDEEEADRFFEIIDSGKVPGVTVNY